MVAGPTLLVVLGVGFLYSQSFLKRIDAITQTCRAIMAGRFSERVKGAGSHGEVERLSSTINSMLDRISSLMENLREVSSAVAHDLRTPLTRLRQKLERTRQSARTQQDFQESMDQAIANTDEILAIFTSLLNLSRIESGMRAASFAPVSLGELLTDVANIYAPLATDQGQTLERELRVAATIAGDRTLLMQLFSNLVENALHHTPPGTRIRIVLEKDGDDVLVEVTDNGPGLTAEERDKAFRRFWRADASRGKPGHGLGLSISGAVTALHGARIQLSDAQPGLKVTVRFLHSGTEAKADDHLLSS
jgi:signal transduction histidine kinase